MIVGSSVSASHCVVDKILDLQQAGFQLYPVRGNHEATFIKAYDFGWEFFQYYLENNKNEAFLGNDLYDYLQFFSELEYAYESGDYLLCHTEFLMGESSIYRGMKSMFSAVNFDIGGETLLTKTQIVGHTVQTLEEIQQNIQNQSRVIGIDSGCVYKNRKGLGFLTAFDFDSRVIVTQKNIEED